MPRIVANTIDINNNANWILTPAEMPKVSKAKYMVNSKLLLTGCLNLTIDNAPIIPKDKAISPAITVVIIYAILGSKINVPKKWYVLTQFWPTSNSDDLSIIPDKIRKVTKLIGERLSNMFDF